MKPSNAAYVAQIVTATATQPMNLKLSDNSLSRPMKASNHSAKKNESREPIIAPSAGIEPAAYRLGGDRSIQLSYEGR